MGKCLNISGCLLASRNEAITVGEEEAFVCPECGQALIASKGGAGRKPMAIPVIILGGISLLVIMGAGGIYIRVLHLKDKQPAGQIGSSFEQAQVAGEHGEFLPSRHMSAITPGPAPEPGDTPRRRPK